MAFPTHVNDKITDSLAPANVNDGPFQAELIAVAGVDAGAAIDVLASEAQTQGFYAAEARSVLEGLAKQISAALAASMPPVSAPSLASRSAPPQAR
jgi:hypothetical protein